MISFDFTSLVFCSDSQKPRTDSPVTPCAFAKFKAVVYAALPAHARVQRGEDVLLAGVALGESGVESDNIACSLVG